MKARTSTAAAKEIAALALAQGGSFSTAATAAGVGLKTVKVWSANDPAFKPLVEKYRRELMGRIVDRVAVAGLKAVLTLEDLLNAKYDDSTRLKAAATLLPAVVSLREHADLAAKLDDLSARVDQASAGRHLGRGA